MLRNEKILISGCGGQVGFPVARALARDNEVYGLGRFHKPEDRGRLESIGVRCVTLDLASDDFRAVPADFDLVLHFAVVKSGDFAYDLAANVEGTGRLMAHCRDARAFLHCSSGAVYAEPGRKKAKESDPLGDNHRVLLPSYSICKIAAESMARFSAQHWQLPTIIPRLSVPYGDNGGWPWYHVLMIKSGVAIPLHPDGPSVYNPIHEDDYIEQIPKLLELASVPATTLNWGGSERAGIEEWCAYIGELTGRTPTFVQTENTLRSLELDLTRMHELIGETKVGWRDGIRRMIEARDPDLLTG